MSDVLLSVEGLTRRFDVSKPWLNRVIEREERQFLTANADVSFEIRKGETFALVGESGPPLTLAKACSRSGCGRIFPLFSRVMREELFTGSGARACCAQSVS